jgi:hypothetical protein
MMLSGNAQSANRTGDLVACRFDIIAPMKHALLFAALAPLVIAQTLQEYSSETRFQLDLKVPDAALATYLPKG